MCLCFLPLTSKKLVAVTWHRARCQDTVLPTRRPSQLNDRSTDTDTFEQTPVGFRRSQGRTEFRFCLRLCLLFIRDTSKLAACVNICFQTVVLIVFNFPIRLTFIILGNPHVWVTFYYVWDCNAPYKSYLCIWGRLKDPLSLLQLQQRTKIAY